MVKAGIDVSEHNGTIEWEKVKTHIDFAILRAGYGRKNVDKKFTENIADCEKRKIPVGIYWFSYATSVAGAKQEAEKCIATIAKYKITYPVYFDFEYDSINNFRKVNGRSPTKKNIEEITTTFLSAIEKAGYKGGLYVNPDLGNRYFSSLLKNYELWVAHWGVDKPGIPCKMWQDSNKARIEGISGPVDSDLCYKDYASSNDLLEKCFKTYNEIYLNLAHEIIGGKWGAGAERVRKLKANDYDPNLAQAIVNLLLM